MTPVRVASDAAAAWERWAGWYESAAAPLGEWFCRAVDARPGLAALDVGCGAGFPALAVAARLRPGGRLVATDIAPAMTDVVARRARALGLGEVVVRAADASELPFDDGAFEAVTCSTVLMLCPDPVRAASEMRRVLRRGGRLAVAVWDERSRSPFFDLALDTLSAVLPVPQDSDRPGPFRLARRGALEEVLQAAGFSTATTEKCPFAFECSSPEEYVEAFISLATGLRDRLATLPAQEADRLRSALAARARAYAVSGRLRLGAVALCAAAPKE